MDGRTAAAILGVAPQATRDEIRRAFRAGVKRVHPDAGPGGSDQAFIALRAAFETLMAGARTTAIDGWVGLSARRATVDLTDVVRRPHPRCSGRSAGPTVDRRGRSFDDHLAAALASADRHRAVPA